MSHRDDVTTTWRSSVPHMRHLCLLTKPSKGKVRFIGEPNVSHIDFVNIKLLQHSVRERLSCVHDSSTKTFGVSESCIETSGGCGTWHGAWTCVLGSRNCNTSNGNPASILKHLLNDFNSHLCKCLRWEPCIVSTIIINVLSLLKSFKQNLYLFLFKPFLRLNFPCNRHHVSTTLWFRRWHSKTRNIHWSNE